MDLSTALLMEGLITIHMSLFVLKPLSEVISVENSWKVFWILFVSRIVLLLFCDIFITPNTAIIDLLAVFVGAIIVMPLHTAKRSPLIEIRKTHEILNASTNLKPVNVILKCSKCGAFLRISDQVCSTCGTPFDGNNVQVLEDTSPVINTDQFYLQSEKKILKNLLKEEVRTQGEDLTHLTTRSLTVKKNILLTIFGLLTVLNTVLYFFNYSIFICLGIESIGFLLYWLLSKNFNTLNVLMREAQKKPNEELTNLVKEIQSKKQRTFISPMLKLIVVVLLAIGLPCALFYQPRLLYTRYGDGYQVFRYTKGITHASDEVVIPSTYSGKQVVAIGERAFQNVSVSKVTIPSGIVSIKTKAFYNAKEIQTLVLPATVVEIRGRAFANMSNLLSISLPEGLKEIRGGAFANDYQLTNVTLPTTLEYLGGSAFSHCRSITEMTIPSKVTEINGNTFEYMTSLKTIHLHDNITYIHGEVFIGDYFLDHVQLPSKIKEIKGSTFEGCSSLSSIVIPEGVTRIGGHAFYGCYDLSYVYVPKTVKEIGSSAFRRCRSLKTITIPLSASVNERAFKDSPTSIKYYNY